MKYKFKILSESKISLRGIKNADYDRLNEVASDIEKNYGGIKIDKGDAKTIIDITGKEIGIEDERLVGINTINKILQFLEIHRFIKEDIDVARNILIAITKIINKKRN